MSRISIITRAAIIIVSLAVAACSKVDFKEFAQNTRVRAENFGAEAAAKDVAYPVPNDGEDGIVVPPKPVVAKADNGDQLDGAATQDGVTPSTPTIMFYTPK